MTSTKSLLALEKGVLEKDFYLFVRNAWPHADNVPYNDNWHIRALCMHLQAVHEGRIQRLVINVPPATAKSLITSVMYPLWVWTTKPDHKFLSTSFSMDLSVEHARKSRELLMSPWFQARWPIKLNADQNQKVDFGNPAGGKRLSKPLHGLTGSRGNTVIFDDPHSVKQGESTAERMAAVDSFRSSLNSRVYEPKKDSFIVIMQRVHEDDVSGFILERQAELGYCHLRIPMEYDGGDDPTTIGWTDPRKEDGELLFPSHFTPESVRINKASMPAHQWSGQYQQRPAPREAGMIDTRWFNRYKLGTHPVGCNFYMTSDHAPSGHGDYNVFRMWAIDHERNLWLVDSFRRRCIMDEALGITRVDGRYRLLATGAIPMIKRWEPYAFFPERDNTWITLESLFRSACIELGVHVSTIPQPTQGMGNKADKAQSYIAIASMGQVYLPEGPIGEDALTEYGKFPTGRHDDQVDADAMIGRVIRKLITGSRSEAPKQQMDFLEYDDDDGMTKDSYY